MNKSLKYIPAEHIMKAFPQVKSLELLTTIFYILNYKSTKELMQIFGLSMSGVKDRKTRIYKKTGCNGSMGLIQHYLSVEKQINSGMILIADDAGANTKVGVK